MGLAVMAEMMQAEVTAKVGPKHAKFPDRTAVRHTAAAGSVVLGGRRLRRSCAQGQVHNIVHVRLPLEMVSAADSYVVVDCVANGHFVTTYVFPASGKQP
ncbi:MAG: hypothetical protein ACR2HR_15730 [Euzebya sp.]